MKIAHNIGLITLLLGLAGCSNTVGIAVKRGQQLVDATALPLVCLSIATDDAALPLDSVDFEDVRTHQTIHAVLSKTFDSAHPNMLTALSGTSRSLSLPILHLSPGKYIIKKMEFIGPALDNGISSFEFDASSFRYAFDVKSGVVNYVGGIAIGADWQGVHMPVSISNIKASASSEHFKSVMQAENTAQRDAKWATDVVPGLRALPSTFSSINIL